MNTRILGTLLMVVTFTLFMMNITGCGDSNEGPSLKDIPQYPNATEVESMKQSSPGGLVGGKLVQYTTDDSFDDVVDFYTDALDTHSPKLLSHESELGRQAAFTIPLKKGMISVAIQEFTEEETVNITIMAVGG